MDNNYQTQPQNQTQPQDAQPTIQPQATSNIQPSEPIVTNSNESTTPSIDNQTRFADDQLTNMSNEEVVANFAKGLLTEKNLGEMDEATEKDMVQDLIERINDFVNRAVLESLPKEKLDELDDMIDSDTATPEAVAQLIQNSGIDASAVAVKAMEKFREVYLDTSIKQEA